MLAAVRYALRGLRRTPGFTFVALATLALGIGANSAIFSLVRAVVLRPPPFPQAEQLVYVWNDNRREKIPDDITSWPTYSDWRAQNRTFARMAGYTPQNANLTGEGEPEQIRACGAGDDFFETLGISPALGRWFSPEEQGLGKDGVVILSHGLWQRRYGADPAILGRNIQVNGHSRTVVGVMPPRFAFPAKTELYVPLAPPRDRIEARGTLWLPVVGRLKPGVAVAQAQSDLGVINDRIEKEFQGQSGYGVRVVGMHEWSVREVSAALWILLGAVGCVLLITCANLANLLLARGLARRREIAIRCALGANRGQIIRQLLAEALLLALGGGALGLTLGTWGLSVLTKLGASYLPRPDLISTDSFVLAVTASVSVLCGLAFGLVPAWQVSRSDPQEALKAGGAALGGSKSAEWTRASLVVAQTALSVVLLIGAGLLLRSFWVLAQVPTGLKGEQLLSLPLALPRAKYDDQRAASFVRDLQARLAQVPGVQAASVTTSILLSRVHDSGTFTVEGKAWAAQESRPELPVDSISPDYFSTMGVPLVAGRAFNEWDAPGRTRVAIVNETFARIYFPGPAANALGRRFLFGDPPPPPQPGQAPAPGAAQAPPAEPEWLTIVGVVRDTRRQGADLPVRMESFLPVAQSTPRYFTVVLRAALSAEALARPLRAAVWSLDRDLPVPQLEAVTAVLDAANAPRRLNLALIGAFAALALGLAAMGLHGLMSYSVLRRTGEFGLRLALGAQPTDVRRLVLAQGGRLMALGLGIGLIFALMLSRLVESLLFGVRPYDPYTYLGVIGVLALSAFLACWFPARRATRIEPMLALRAE